VQNRLPADLRLTIYRVVEEALANVQRHARATRATVELGRPNPAELAIRIVDNGRGLPPGPVTAGLGLNAIAARVAQVGGTWRLQDAPAGGAQLLVCVPFHVEGAHRAAGAEASGALLEQVEHSLR
jgi:two-component system, NarL family, sensor kinase